MSTRRITVVRGDITTLQVDVVVNAANNAMRGGRGVDGAIHRAGGRAVLDACIEKFPHGLATGDAGWTEVVPGLVELEVAVPRLTPAAW